MTSYLLISVCGSSLAHVVFRICLCSWIKVKCSSVCAGPPRSYSFAVNNLRITHIFGWLSWNTVVGILNISYSNSACWLWYCFICLALQSLKRVLVFWRFKKCSSLNKKVLKSIFYYWCGTLHNSAYVFNLLVWPFITNSFWI